MIEATRVAVGPRPPRSMVWILLLASAGAVMAAGVIERWFERSAVRRYSAHYMAVLRKPA